MTAPEVRFHEVAGVVDRIEGPLAVIEVDGAMAEWPVTALPSGVKEGDRVRVVFFLEVPPSAPKADEGPPPPRRAPRTTSL